MTAVINVKQVSKSFLLSNTLKDRVCYHLFHSQSVPTFQALKEISFTAYKGETIGIVGHNGSGKSTLLQLICSVLQPDKGQIDVKGRIAALLELGSGFNPDFTGKENIFFNAALLGLKQHEIQEKYKSIVEFADIGDFLERPVRTYSSGMALRLAFAVAIHVDPQILIIDEALSVGDAAFQRKCQAKLKQMIAKGVTLLFVSHSAGQVIELCDRAILLDQGELLMNGSPKDVVHAYHKLLHMEQGPYKDQFRTQLRQHNQNVSLNTNSISDRHAHAETILSRANWNPELTPKSTVWYSPNGAIISSPCIVNEHGEQVNVLEKNKLYRYQYTVSFKEEAFEVGFGMMIKNINGIEIAGYTSTKNHEKRISYITKGTEICVTFEFICQLKTGSYFLNCGCSAIKDDNRIFLHRGVDVAMFSVIDDNLDATGMLDIGIKFSQDVIET